MFSVAVAEAKNVHNAAVADWTQVTDARLNEALEGLKNAMNTFQTAEQTGDLASQTSLDELKASLTNAQSLLDDIGTSTDGSDIALGSRWSTQEAKDAFQAAIYAAQAVLDNENATQNDIEAALKDLAAAQSTFQNACHDGTMISSGASEGDNNDSGSSDKNTGLAQTGDMLLYAPLALGILAALSAIIAIVAKRRSAHRRS